VPGGNYTARLPHRKRSVSGAGLSKLILIKTRCSKAYQHIKRVNEIRASDPSYDITPYLEAVQTTLESVIDLCEESIPDANH
jgi:hypothetical protein